MFFYFLSLISSPSLSTPLKRLSLTICSVGPKALDPPIFLEAVSITAFVKTFSKVKLPSKASFISSPPEPTTEIILAPRSLYHTSLCSAMVSRPRSITKSIFIILREIIQI